MAADGQQIKLAADQLTAAVDAFNQPGKDTSFNRQKIIRAAQKVLDEAVLPEEWWMENGNTISSVVASRLFMGWGAFDAIPTEGSITFDALAEKINAEEALTRRIASQLTTTGVLTQVGDNEIAHNRRSLICVRPNPHGLASQAIFDDMLVPCVNLPRYFEHYPRKSPGGPTHTPCSFANGQPEKTFWEILSADPERMRMFMLTMSIAEKLMPFKGVYDFGWLAEASGKDSERKLIVDVGGGKGHAVEAICEENTWIDASRCVVQDLGSVVEEVEASGQQRAWEAMAHDFTTEQPVKGACIYHIRRCLHDFPDETCTQILSQLSAAMAPDSRLLVVEQVLDNPPSRMGAWFDFVMMCIGGRERTRQDFEKICAAAGLRIANVYSVDGAPAAVVECVKLEQADSS